MVYILLLAINISLLFVYRSDKKYWLISISIWMILVTSFVIWRLYKEKEKDKIETAYLKSQEITPGGDRKLLWKIDAEREPRQTRNMIFLHLIFLQSLITFVCQIFGYHLTSSKRIYDWTTAVCGIIFILNLVLEVMFAIVPTGGMLG